MSNYTDFFPLATGGGSTEITDPDKIPKVTAGASSSSGWGYMFYNLGFNGYQFYTLSQSFNAYFGIVSQTTDNTEITLANVTGSGGYLCCVVTPMGNQGAVQELKITVDGGTEKVYTYDYSVNTDVDNYYQRLIYGFSANGSPTNYNLANDTTASGIFGLGGGGLTFNNFTSPPITTDKVNGLYSGSNYYAKATAIYYLDNQL
jgi:hypothetical protein